jgi:hypothetical protein
VGFCLNPPGEKREDYLNRVGIRLEVPEMPDSKDLLLVCLVDNGPFKAAGVAVNQTEFDAMRNDGTTRPRTWWWIGIQDALSVMHPGDREHLKKNYGIG